MASLNPNSSPYVPTIQYLHSFPPPPPLPPYPLLPMYRRFTHNPHISYYVSPYYVFTKTFFNPNYNVPALPPQNFQVIASCTPATEVEEEKEEIGEEDRESWNHQGRRQKIRSLNFKVDAETLSGEGKTTVMIRNIPNKFNKAMVLELLDKHCLKENRKLNPNSSTMSEFNFLYLPMDFKSGLNLGYGFVNFTSPIAAWRLYRELNLKSWEGMGPTRKICEVTYARIQGLHALLQHFRNSTFVCPCEDYLPVHFSPSRNGQRLANQRLVGKYIPKPRI